MKIETIHLHKPKDIFVPILEHYQKQLKNWASATKSRTFPEKSDHNIWVGLDVQGKQKTSEELASWIDNLTTTHKKVIFFVGDVEGFTSEQRLQFDNLLSLSQCTLTADFAYILLWEQIFRAHCILTGKKYHR